MIENFNKLPPQSFKKRSLENISLKNFETNNFNLNDLCIAKINKNLEQIKFQNILRMPIYIKNYQGMNKKNNIKNLATDKLKDYFIPDNIVGIKELISFIEFCHEYQEKNLNKYDFVYLTIRQESDNLRSQNIHVDGFSTRYQHFPECNYIFTTSLPTKAIVKNISFPENFNPNIHNIHKYLEKTLEKKQFNSFIENNIYILDPYIPHYKPENNYNNTNKNRLLVRLSFIPIEIEDDNFTKNPLLQTKKYNRNGANIADSFVDYI